MQLMAEIGPQVNYYTIPENSNFVIGSHSKNANGLYFGEQIELNLSSKEHRTQKRIFDIFWALASIVVAPLLILLPKTRKWVVHAGPVLIGNKTWVGYSCSKTSMLPHLSPGVYTTDYQLVQPNEQFSHNLDLLYAKNYKVSMDVQTLVQASSK